MSVKQWRIRAGVGLSLFVGGGGVLYFGLVGDYLYAFLSCIVALVGALQYAGDYRQSAVGFGLVAVVAVLFAAWTVVDRGFGASFTAVLLVLSVAASWRGSQYYRASRVAG